MKLVTMLPLLLVVAVYAEPEAKGISPTLSILMVFFGLLSFVPWLILRSLDKKKKQAELIAAVKKSKNESSRHSDSSE